MELWPVLLLVVLAGVCGLVVDDAGGGRFILMW